MKHPIHTLLLAIAAAIFPLSPCPAQEAQPAAPAPLGFECPKIDKPFVHLPIKYGAPKVKLLVKVDGELQHAIFVNLAHDKADWNGTFTVDHWMGKKLTIVPENPSTPAGWLQHVKLSDQLSDEESVYKKKYRPQFHFTGRRGWISDVNGTFYLNGTYHLMFQHKPWQTEEPSNDDAVWGHAVSTDLVHWKELGSSARISKLGNPFSGSAVVDWYNTSGLVKEPIKDKGGRLHLIFNTPENMGAEGGRDMLLACAKAHPIVLSDPPISIFLQEIGNGYTFELEAEVADVTTMKQVASDIRFSVDRALRAKS